ncbi:RNA directed DNA polymerase (reverse transcriptase) [Echinococcus multilocularis]|uniref:RNA directed DNA polymerase (Reverse transcriptase) n=1 Tax=Echinococcus multilocularis TaxID=6211 RepID=A0A0S4MN31_ECHMU|nr:RNA directed DNA polymerase (reverse transcriptase) [Echinococcus multilocularis]
MGNWALGYTSGPQALLCVGIHILPQQYSFYRLLGEQGVLHWRQRKPIPIPKDNHSECLMTPNRMVEIISALIKYLSSVLYRNAFTNRRCGLSEARHNPSLLLKFRQGVPVRQPPALAITTTSSTLKPTRSANWSVHAASVLYLMARRAFPYSILTGLERDSQCRVFCNAKALLSFAEGVFSTQRGTEVNAGVSLPKEDADDICSDLFGAAADPTSTLVDLCAQLTHVSDANDSCRRNQTHLATLQTDITSSSRRSNPSG